MGAGKLNAKKQNQHGGKKQAEKQKRISAEIEEFLAKDRENLRWQKTEHIVPVRCRDGRTSLLARGRRGFAQFFAAIKLSVAHPQENSEERNIHGEHAELEGRCCPFMLH